MGGRQSSTAANAGGQEGPMTTIKGNLVFQGGSPGSIPNGSVLKVQFQDTNLMDAAAVDLGEHVQTISNYTNGDTLAFEIKTNRRPAHGLPGSLSAVLNMGWTPSGDDWLREGDWFN